MCFGRVNQTHVPNPVLASVTIPPKNQSEENPDDDPVVPAIVPVPLTVVSGSLARSSVLRSVMVSWSPCFRIPVAVTFAPAKLAQSITTPVALMIFTVVSFVLRRIPSPSLALTVPVIRTRLPKGSDEV